MKFASCWCLAAIGLASPALAQPAAPPAASSAIQVDGTLKVSGKFTVNAGIPDGTTVTISVSTSLSDASFGDEGGASPTATVSKGKVSFAVALPYTWLVASTKDSVSIELNVSAQSSSKGVSYSFSTYLSQTIALPKTGATTAVAFSGSL
jgi:hypothetical protein